MKYIYFNQLPPNSATSWCNKKCSDYWPCVKESVGHRWISISHRWIPPHKGLVTRKSFPCHDVIMYCNHAISAGWWCISASFSLYQAVTVGWLPFNIYMVCIYTYIISCTYFLYSWWPWNILIRLQTGNGLHWERYLIYQVSLKWDHWISPWVLLGNWWVWNRT